MSSYCVKCKKKTKNVGGKIETAKNPNEKLIRENK